MLTFSRAIVRCSGHLLYNSTRKSAIVSLLNHYESMTIQSGLCGNVKNLLVCTCRHHFKLGRFPVLARSATSSCKNEEESNRNQAESILVYEGPFAALTLKLKRVSLTSAVIGLIGLPTISLFYGGGSIPATGQIAIIVTAGLTAVGSTALLGYCFSPYVHTLELLQPPKSQKALDGSLIMEKPIEIEASQKFAKIITRDVFARIVETVFDPATDVTLPPKNNSRPFCNFMVKGMPMYIHPELLNNDDLRLQLLGKDPPQEDRAIGSKIKTDEDEFL